MAERSSRAMLDSPDRFRAGIDLCRALNLSLPTELCLLILIMSDRSVPDTLRDISISRTVRLIRWEG